MLRKFSTDIVNKINNILGNSLEKVLFGLVISLFLVLFLTQIGLVSSYTRPYLTDVDVYEGRVINEIDNITQEATLTLELVDAAKERDVKILVNGREVSAFNDKYIDIKVKNNSIIEIDSSKLKSPIRVRIVGQSNNLKQNLLGSEVTLNSNIKVLARVLLK